MARPSSPSHGRKSACVNGAAQRCPQEQDITNVLTAAAGLAENATYLDGVATLLEKRIQTLDGAVFDTRAVLPNNSSSLLISFAESEALPSALHAFARVLPLYRPESSPESRWIFLALC